MRACIFLSCLGLGTLGAAVTAIGTPALIQILGLLALVGLGLGAIFVLCATGDRITLRSGSEAVENR